MAVNYLENLNCCVERLLQQEDFWQAVAEYKEQILYTEEAFVWAVIDLNQFKSSLPEIIRSGWIFLLKRDRPSGAHYHPNSIQHMVMIEGEGESRIANISKSMIRFAAPDHSLAEIWNV